MIKRIYYICDMLIDQGRFIGDDPIGYGCSNLATIELPNGALICERCLVIYKNQPIRLTLADHFGKKVQDFMRR